MQAEINHAKYLRNQVSKLRKYQNSDGSFPFPHERNLSLLTYNGDYLLEPDDFSKVCVYIFFRRKREKKIFCLHSTACGSVFFSRLLPLIYFLLRVSFWVNLQLAGFHNKIEELSNNVEIPCFNDVIDCYLTRQGKDDQTAIKPKLMSNLLRLLQTFSINWRCRGTWPTWGNTGRNYRMFTSRRIWILEMSWICFLLLLRWIVIGFIESSLIIISQFNLIILLHFNLIIILQFDLIIIF